MFDGAKNLDREKMNQGMRDHLKAITDMFNLMKNMWTESNPKAFLNFRTFIMG